MVIPYLLEEWQRERDIVTLDDHGVVKAVGNYTLKQTLGKGSMGKVKLGVDDAGIQVAIKIVPRATRSRKLTGKEMAREIRAIREGHLMMLLHHPHIVQLSDMVAGRHFYYFLMEYVGGGQLLHYIVKRERLSEKRARRFCRQIVSALDYLHRNSVVHRDLKIENILVDETGRNIKIIDFGLSNLFCPERQLTTYCGSLYFAAPELLCGRPYHGPEIDVWSLGVVLYVMVTGSVPFDDKSLPGLHEKIKRAQVAYPAYLSSTCHHLLSHIFVADPHQRITLADIILHDWINEARPSLVNNFLPLRKPLTLPLDDNVIHRMTFGFNLGSMEEIKKKMQVILQSSVYQVSAAHIWEMQRRISKGDSSTSQEALVSHPAPSNTEADPGKKKKNRLSQASSLLSSGSQSGAIKHMIWGTYHDPQTVPAAYHPLLSIYYLTLERLQRMHGLVPDVLPSQEITHQAMQDYIPQSEPPHHQRAFATSTRSLPATAFSHSSQHHRQHRHTHSHQQPEMAHSMDPTSQQKPSKRSLYIYEASHHRHHPSASSSHATTKSSGSSGTTSLQQPSRSGRRPSLLSKLGNIFQRPRHTTDASYDYNDDHKSLYTDTLNSLSNKDDALFEAQKSPARSPRQRSHAWFPKKLTSWMHPPTTPTH